MRKVDMRVNMPSVSNDVVRAWAFRNGVPCPERGQVPNAARERFDEARMAAAVEADNVWIALVRR